MNKRKAQAMADAGGFSIRELRQAIADSRGRQAVSTVNPAILYNDALDIYDRSLSQRLDDEVPVMWKPDPYSRSGRMQPTRDRLIVVNILRDCGGAIRSAREGI